MSRVEIPKPEYAKYRKASDCRLHNKKWDVMSANLARKLMSETEELNKPSWVNNIYHGHIDQVEWLITTAQAEAYADAVRREALEEAAQEVELCYSNNDSQDDFQHRSADAIRALIPHNDNEQGNY